VSTRGRSGSDPRRSRSVSAGVPSTVTVGQPSPATDDPSGAAPGGTLAVAGVSVRFGGLLALDDVSLEVRPGEVVGVIGPNGAGKTTLFNVISGFVQPEAGVLYWQGRRLRRLRPHHLAGLGIARTLQGVGLWSGLSVVENVMTGAQPALAADLASALLGLWRSSGEERRTRRRAVELLDRLGVGEWADRSPDALPYAVRKRVALARALMSEPRLLLLDEPASGLSPGEMDGLVELLAEVRHSTSVLLVEHHMDLVMAVCDRLVVLDFGQVIATGTPEEVRASPEVTTAYLGVAVEAGAGREGPDGAAG
jgi:branched-chain amino acid transport system ATP-binding protein